MIYVFDTSSIVVMNNYYPDIFPSFWSRIDQLAADGTVTSTREVMKELSRYNDRPHSLEWAKRNSAIFRTPDANETTFVARIFAVPHFKQVISEKARLKGTPVADPFVIAAAQARNGKVVTEEVMRKNAAKIPNICEHFEIACIDLATFLNEQGWTF